MAGKTSRDTTSHQNDNVEALQKKVEQLTEERDCALEMWHLSKSLADRAKREIHKNAGGVNDFQQELDKVKAEYSEAIQMLETKIVGLESSLSETIEKNHSLVKQVEKLSDELEEQKRISSNRELLIRNVEAERDSLAKSLDQAKGMLKVAEDISVQARNKVAEALVMTQDALSNEASLLEEKTRMEEEVQRLISATNEKATSKIEEVRNELENKIDQLSTQLHTVTIERNQLSLECRSLKGEMESAERELMSKNKILMKKLEALREMRQSEMAQWYEERDMLRRQVTSLQSETESLLSQLRRKQYRCNDCEEYKQQSEMYKKLAKKWEETADSVTQNFEAYLNEAKAAHKAKKGEN